MARKFDYELLREGEVSKDGRLLMPGSVTWRDELPVWNEAGEIIGALTNVERRDNGIWGVSAVECAPDEHISIGGDQYDPYFVEDGTFGEIMVFPNYRMCYGVKTNKYEYNWD